MKGISYVIIDLGIESDILLHAARKPYINNNNNNNNNDNDNDNNFF